MSLTWDERLCFSLLDVHFALHYDRHVRMTHFSLIINDLNARLDQHLLIYPCRATLKLHHHRTYSLLHLDFSSLTGKIDFNILAYLITVTDQIRSIVDKAVSIFRPSKIPDPIDNDIISVDDLRNGSMKCIFQATHDLPGTNEIYFTTTNHHHIASCMTWKYPQRRSILKCHILPLPFDADINNVAATYRPKTVDCLMQYWHFGTKQFVTWQTFELSDGQALFLDFSNDLGQNPYSEMWRIVLVNAASIINQANSLAASTRIDSLQSQRYEPSIEMTIKIPNIRLHLLLNLPTKSSTKFQSILHGCSHDVATLNLDNLSFDLSQRLETKLISIETLLSIETLDYRFLTKRSCIEPAVVNLDLFIDTSKSSILTTTSDIFELNNNKYNQLFRSAKTSIVYQLQFDIDHINIRLSQSLCHLINILYQNWIRSDMIKVLNINPTQSLLSIDQDFYYTYYLFTNHLNIPIGLKQTNTTDKFLVLPSLQTRDFVWSKLNIKDMLIEFSLEETSSEPFKSTSIDIHHTDKKMKQIVQFENSPHQFFLYIDHDEHRIRRHMHILGRLIIKNLSNFDLNIKFYLHVGSRQIDLFIPKTQSTVSCLQTIDDIESIQWNSSLKYRIDQLNEEGIISSSDQTSIWIHLIHTENFTCFLFTPIVVYRSYLTQPVFLHLNKTKPSLLPSHGHYTSIDSFVFDKSNQIYEHRLQQIDAEQITGNVFQLTQRSHVTLNPLEYFPQESHSLIDYFLDIQSPSSSSEQSPLDLLRQEHHKLKQTEDDIPIPLIEQNNEILNTSLIPTIGANGPAMYEPAVPISTKKTSSAPMTSNSIDCRIEPIRLYAHLNTILIQLKPSTLINNLTPFNFHFYANAGHDHVYIASEQITCLSSLQYSQIQFLLIDPNDGEHIQCQTIDLIFRNIPLMTSNTILNHRLFANQSLDLFFIKSSNNDYFICHLKHEYLDHTHILTLQSKYRLFNSTIYPLICSILPIGKQQYVTDYPFHSFAIEANEQINLYRFQGIPSTDMIYQLVFQFHGYEKQYLSKPIQLLSIINENGNRQCFSLFHRDEPIKSKTTSYQSLRGELFSFHQTIASPSQQIDLTIHSNPSWAYLQIINACPCPLLCRLENISSMSHIIPPLSSVFIGIDSSNSLNPNSGQNFINGSRFYLAQFTINDNAFNPIQLISQYFQQITSKTVQWSRPIRIDAQFEDVFLPVPGLHDVLIRSVPVSLSASRTIILEPVQRQRATKTTITSKSNSSMKTDFSLPNMTMISETNARQYRTNIFDRVSTSPNASNQYLKSWQQQYNQANHRQLQMNFSIKKISLSLMDELNEICLFREILRVTFDKIDLLFYQHSMDTEPILCQEQFFCSIEQLQMDNQCFSSKNNFDFPVILMSKDEKRVSKKKINIYERKEPIE